MYLDVKPENIRMYATTPEMVELFDFDTVIPQGMKEGLSNYRVACSRGYAPLEQKMGDMSQIGTYTDIYAVGALLFSLIFYFSLGKQGLFGRQICLPDTRLPMPIAGYSHRSPHLYRAPRLRQKDRASGGFPWYED